jgi:hypothetical protein
MEDHQSRKLLSFMAAAPLSNAKNRLVPYTGKPWKW